jgi:hypothetical protein
MKFKKSPYSGVVAPPRPDLSDTEVDALCGGLRQNAAKVRYLIGLGLTVNVRPNGRPLVWRTHADQVLSGLISLQPSGEIGVANTESLSGDRAGILSLFSRKCA